MANFKMESGRSLPGRAADIRDHLIAPNFLALFHMKILSFGIHRIIVFTVIYHDRLSKADAMATALRDDFGVPVKWTEGKSRNTAENAAFSAALLRPDAVRRVLLVTDAMHMPRSRTAFQRAGMDVVAAPTLFFSHAPLTVGAYLPSAEGLRESWYAIYELLGIAWYGLRYHDPLPGTRPVSDVR